MPAYSPSRSRSPGGDDVDEERIQKLVEERQECRRNKDFDRADQLREELKDMGVNINDTDLTWKGPRGMRGSCKGAGKGGGGGGKGGGKERRPGDWDCDECGKMNFAMREECFSCGAPRYSSGGRGGGGRYDDYDDRRGGRGGDRYDDRRGGGDRYGRGRDRYDDRRPSRRDSRSPPPRRRRDRDSRSPPPRRRY